MEDGAMGRRLGLAVFALAVAGAALVAHVAIDLAGDVLLTHDTYDDLAHHSRESVFAAALVLGCLVLWRTIRSAQDDLAGSRGALKLLLASAVPASCARFIVTVSLGTLPALLAMAKLDALIDARRVDDIGDLLGGSVPLGSACTLAGAIVVGALVWKVVRILARLDHVILRFIAILAQRPRNARVIMPSGPERRPCTLTASILCARSVGLRAPPLPA